MAGKARLIGSRENLSGKPGRDKSRAAARAGKVIGAAMGRASGLRIGGKALFHNPPGAIRMRVRRTLDTTGAGFCQEIVFS